MKNILYTLKKVVLVQVVLVLGSTVGYSNGLYFNGEKEGKSSAKEARIETEPKGTKSEKPDSTTLTPSQTAAKEQQAPASNHKREDEEKNDSKEESGSVISFNFIQYIIENYKFSEEVF